MLVLSRKLNQEILVGEDIKITVLKIKGNTVRLGIEAPRDVHVIRGELADSAANSAVHSTSQDEPHQSQPQPSKRSTTRESQMAEFTVVFSNGSSANSEKVSIPFTQAGAQTNAQAKNRAKTNGKDQATASEAPIETGLSLVNPALTHEPTTETIQFRDRLPISLEHNRLKEIVNQLIKK